MPESESTSPANGRFLSTDLLARLPLTADSAPIFLGDTVFVENEDAAYFGPDAILELKVECLSVGTSFDEYKGTVTVCGPDLECGNLDCYANKETLQGILGANVKEHAPPPLSSNGKETEELHGGCCDSPCSPS